MKFIRQPGFFSNSRAQTDKTITIVGRFLWEPTVSTTQVTLPLTIDSGVFGPRLQSIGSCFQEFRFKRILVKLHPASSSMSVRQNYVVAYSKALAFTAPTTMADAYQLANSRLSSLNDTIPQTLMLNSQILRQGTRVWYDCAGSTSGVSANDATQGNLFVIGDGSCLPQIEVSYTIQFRGACPPDIG
jgi:hypothetical protein